MNDPSEDKASLRLKLQRALRTISDAERLAASVKIIEKISSQPFWSFSHQILAFIPMIHEPDIWPLVCGPATSGKRFSFPRYNAITDTYEICEINNLSEDLRPGHFGILEPVPNCQRIPLNRLDLALVPGLGFSPSGARIGRGKGYYDKLLAEVSATKCGIAFDSQILADIPIESHDIRMDVVITELRCLASTPVKAI